MQGDESLHKSESDQLLGMPAVADQADAVEDEASGLIEPGAAEALTRPSEKVWTSDGDNDPAQVSADQDDSAASESAQSESAPSNSCGVCRQPLSRIFLNVDGNTLIMESCDGCDLRRWQLAGKRIDLKRALEEVEEHVSRARQ